MARASQSRSWTGDTVGQSVELTRRFGLVLEDRLKRLSTPGHRSGLDGQGCQRASRLTAGDLQSKLRINRQKQELLFRAARAAHESSANKSTRRDRLECPVRLPRAHPRHLPASNTSPGRFISGNDLTIASFTGPWRWGILATHGRAGAHNRARRTSDQQDRQHGGDYRKCLRTLAAASVIGPGGVSAVTATVATAETGRGGPHGDQPLHHAASLGLESL